MAATIHRVEDGYVISEAQVWRPGSYASRQAAEYAEQLPDAVLRRLQDEIAPGRITLEMLKRVGAG